MVQYWENEYYGGSPYYTSYWWGAPSGWSDYDLYDYNNDFVLEDNEIADIVRDNIDADYAITYSDENKIKVAVNDGVVTLSGEVNNPRTKPAAYQDAYWSAGVVDVANNIQVKPRKRKGKASSAKGGK